MQNPIRCVEKNEPSWRKGSGKISPCPNVTPHAQISRFPIHVNNVEFALKRARERLGLDWTSTEHSSLSRTFITEGGRRRRAQVNEGDGGDENFLAFKQTTTRRRLRGVTLRGGEREREREREKSTGTKIEMGGGKAAAAASLVVRRIVIRSKCAICVQDS